VFIFLLRVLLIWWIVTILFKWLAPSGARGRNTAAPPSDTGRDDPPDIVHSGRIEDAEFEEMDEG